MAVTDPHDAPVSQGEHRCTCGLIDVHAHCLPPFYKEALAAAGFTSLDGGFPIPDWSPEAAIEVMDRGGVDAMVLSVSSPSVHFLDDPDQRVRLARRLNDSVAETITAHPTRFGGLATLPLPDVAACIAELRRALGDLHLDGVVIETNADGRYLGDPALAPVLAEVAERGVPLFLHPTSPACFEAVGLARPAPLFEFPVDTARTVVDMIFAGVFDRHPTLKLILPHAGGALPALARRIALLSSMPQMKPAPRDPETVRKIFAGIYYDLAMAGDQESFTALRTIAPLSQIVFGSDFPFQQPQTVQANIDYVRDLRGLDVAEHAAIGRGTALSLFPRFASVSSN